MTQALAAYDAVVIAGGRAARLGGADKPAVRIGGRTLLDRVLAACPDAAATVVVGPRRPTGRPVLWTRETPPGGGPLAALDAGLRRATQPLVLVLSADLPFLDTGTVRALLAVPDGCDGCVLTDTTGRDQPLVAAYRAEPLRREIALLAAEHGRLSGLPLHLLLGELALHRLPAAPAHPEATGGSEVPHGPAALASLDCDTWEDIAVARARIREHGVVLEEWITAVKTELGIELDVDTRALLDLARDAAHGVARPAAPLTTFLVGYAAGQQGVDLDQAMHRVSALAVRWQAETDSSVEPSTDLPTETPAEAPPAAPAADVRTGPPADAPKEPGAE